MSKHVGFRQAKILSKQADFRHAKIMSKHVRFLHANKILSKTRRYLESVPQEQKPEQEQQQQKKVVLKTAPLRYSRSKTWRDKF